MTTSDNTARRVMLCGPVRTAIGGFGGALKDTPATELGAIAVRETLRRAGLDPTKVGAVVMGNVIQAGNRMNPARQAAVGAGLPVYVPAMTVNRVCGSGAQAIATAADDILLGRHDFAVGGGMENMDRAPYLVADGRWGHRMGTAEMHDAMLRDGLVDAFSGQHSGWHAEDLGVEAQIGRKAQDEWSARSQARFSEARDAGRFDAEIAPVEIKERKRTARFDRDEPPRPETTADALAALRAAFRDDGMITAGNAPGLNSGASAMVLAEARAAEREGLEPFGRLVAHGLSAVEPGRFGMAPVPAVHQALERAGWNMADVERFEINEAFAVVPLAVAQAIGVPLDIVNVEGGAIAHGHPIGATGAILTTRLLHSMRRDGIRRGIVTLCIGGGQGIALAVEAVAA